MRETPLTTPENLALEHYLEEIRTVELSLTHPLQRSAMNWDKERKSNLVRRVLQGGKFLPLQICTQRDENGLEIRYLIDGKQRMTSLQEFIDDEFAIVPKTIDYMVEYDGVVYEVCNTKNGKFKLKRNKKGLIPVLDENGNTIKARQTIDIRGLKFSQLPPELQKRMLSYIVPAQVKHNCTDEDIRLEIIDYNSGAPMNVAQLGKSRLGAKFATIVTELSEHSFVKNACGFSDTDEVKGAVERSISEALALIGAGVDKWIDDYKTLCVSMPDCIGEEDVERVKFLLDKLDSCVERTETFKKHMVNKEFFIVLANFDYFMAQGYKIECYNAFIQDFVTNKKYEKIINTHDIDDDGNEIYDNYVSVYKTSTKKRDVIKSRLNQMNEWLDKYLEENCDGMIDDDNFEEVVENYVEEFIATEIPHNTKDNALKTLMQFTGYPARDFTKNGVKDFERWVKCNGLSDDEFEDCVWNAIILKEHLNKTGCRDKFSENDIAMLIRRLYIYGEDLDEKAFESWLMMFENSIQCEESGENNSLLEKEMYMINSYEAFINN